MLTLLWSRLLLLRLLNEKVEHLRLDELLYKVSSGLGVDGFVEGPLVKDAVLPGGSILDEGGVVTDGPHEEVQEGLRHHPV